MVLIDCHNLAHRIAHTHHGLSHNGRPTGVIFGFLMQVMGLLQRYPMGHIGEVCFCWDSPRGSLFRRQFFPGYKADRDDRELSRATIDALPQMESLRDRILPGIGLPNQFIQFGHEADDLVAALARHPGRHIVVSSDQDLFQLLGPSVAIHRPGRNDIYSHLDFMAEFGISPQLWIEAKALAGDSSDNVDGIKGVGIKTAIRLLLGNGPRGLIQRVKDNEDIVARNRRLVSLPWPGCQVGEVKQSRLDLGELQFFCNEYGMEGLLT